MKKIITITLFVLTLIACQNDSKVDDLQREIEELKQNSLDLEAENAKEKEEQTRLEEKFPANTYAVATQKRVYFHSKPDKATKLNSFIVSGQYCTVEKVRNGFGYISFVYNNKTTRGWLNLKYIEPYESQSAFNSYKLSDLQFNLIVSNEREAPATSINFLADYKIELKEGNSIIAVFEDSGEGFLSDEKDFVSISTAVPSERTYSFEKKEVDEIIVIKHFFFSDMDIDEDTWRKTYKKDLNNNWKLINCKGNCD